MIDVIIPTYNRANALRKVIDSYFAQEHLGMIIFVDDCSTDDTELFVQSLMVTHPGKVLYRRMDKKSTLPNVRNAGVECAISEYIFMGEDDVLLPVDHFKILLEKSKEHNADLISGRRIDLRMDETQEHAKRLADKDAGPVFVRVPFEAYFERPVSVAQEVTRLHSNALIKRSVFEKVKYDPLYDGSAFREETDFYLRAYDAGFHLWLIPDTWSFHMRNMTVNTSGGSRKKRLVYEYYVWKNTLRLFLKNRTIFERNFDVKNIYWFAMRCLVARYTYAAGRRIRLSIHQTRDADSYAKT